MIAGLGLGGVTCASHLGTSIRGSLSVPPACAAPARLPAGFACLGLSSIIGTSRLGTLFLGSLDDLTVMAAPDRGRLAVAIPILLLIWGVVTGLIQAFLGIPTLRRFSRPQTGVAIAGSTFYKLRGIASRSSRPGKSRYSRRLRSPFWCTSFSLIIRPGRDRWKLSFKR